MVMLRWRPIWNPLLAMQDERLSTRDVRLDVTGDVVLESTADFKIFVAALRRLCRPAHGQGQVSFPAHPSPDSPAKSCPGSRGRPPAAGRRAADDRSDATGPDPSDGLPARGAPRRDLWAPGVVSGHG
jgi:hypothetical protein